MTIQKSRIFLSGLCLAFCAAAHAADWTPGSEDWANLPEIKRSKAALYLTPALAYDMKRQNPEQVALFDIRTRAEAMYVGWPGNADALVPFAEHPPALADWDDKRHMYKLEQNPDFVPEIERRLAQMRLDKSAVIILICRSGDRSSKAADRLLAAGYGKVYSVAEGFEGDMAKEGPYAGQRAVNGWKNTGLPWTYKLDKARMYFPR
jgi:rhodanese-related sulfurtransferase